MFSTINVRLGPASDPVWVYLASKWLDFQGWFKPRFAYCAESGFAGAGQGRSVLSIPARMRGNTGCSPADRKVCCVTSGPGRHRIRRI